MEAPHLGQARWCVGSFIVFVMGLFLTFSKSGQHDHLATANFVYGINVFSFDYREFLLINRQVNLQISNKLSMLWES
jgi:hypothetical protein